MPVGAIGATKRLRSPFDAEPLTGEAESHGRPTLAAQQHATPRQGDDRQNSGQPLHLLNTSAEARVVEPPQLSTSERKLRLAEIPCLKNRTGLPDRVSDRHRGDPDDEGPPALVRHGPRRHRDPRGHVNRRAGPRAPAPRLTGLPQAMRSSLRPARRGVAAGPHARKGAA